MWHGQWGVFGDMHGRGEVHSQGCVCGRGQHGGGGVTRGMCGGGGHVWQGGMHGRGAYMAGETATAVDSMHHTGMHSCLFLGTSP